MTSLIALITALLRLLGLYYFIHALDSAAAPFYMISIQAAQISNSAGIHLPNLWTMFPRYQAEGLVTHTFGEAVLRGGWWDAHACNRLAA